MQRAALPPRTPAAPSLARSSGSPKPLSPFASRWLDALPALGIPAPALLLERFPHVLDKIAAAWGFPADMASLMGEDLLVDRRVGRAGFPFPALLEIHALLEAHDRLHPRASPCPWDSVPARA